MTSLNHEKTDDQAKERTFVFSHSLLVGGLLIVLLVAILVAGLWWGRSPATTGQTAAEAAGILPDHDDTGQPPHPHLTIPETAYDFGTLGHDQKVEHVFELYNTGTVDLVISGVEASCECTTPNIEVETVPAGGMTKLQVVFDPAAHNDPEGGGHADVGDIFRRITISSNDPSYPVQSVDIFANVLEE